MRKYGQSKGIIPQTDFPPDKRSYAEKCASLRCSGFLKFFQFNRDYGFLVCDETKKDVFFHFDDMKDTGLTKKQLILGSNSGHRKSSLLPDNNSEQYEIHFNFEKRGYSGRYGQSFKAVDIQLNYIRRIHVPP